MQAEKEISHKEFINVLVNSDENNFPLYDYSAREQRTFRGSIELDIRKAEISLATLESWNSPPEYFNGIFRRYEIHPGLNASDIRKLIDENMSLFQAVQSGSKIEYDDHNFVGKLNQVALSAERKLSRRLYIDSFFDKNEDDYSENVQRYDNEISQEDIRLRHYE